jgi:hypothetical protein
MTTHEIRERAGAIWGHERIIFLQQRPDGGADVELKPSPRVMQAGAQYGHEHTYSYHRLDANGHAVCHTACKALELAATAAGR